MAASGGYFVLCIGDKVYVDNTSLVGSVGVITGWFGLNKFIEKHKIERRKWSSNEDLLNHRFDPFAEVKEKDKEWWNECLKDTHHRFIHHVEKHRSNKLKIPKPEREEKIY